MSNRITKGCLSKLAPIFVAMSFLTGSAQAVEPQKTLLRAARLFDGNQLLSNAAILITGNKVTAVGPAKSFADSGVKVINLGDSTILPGFIDLHGHIEFQAVNTRSVLEHGVTTARDVGGPLLPMSGGNGRLRLLTSGPIITVQGGYPLPVFGHGHGHGDIAAVVETPEQARQTVRDLIAGGAAIVKIALEPGGEAGAPWTTGHTPDVLPPWSMPSLDIVQAVTDEAHKAGKLVAAHVAENQGAQLALDAGVDEWAHVPCAEVSDELLQRAVDQKVRIVTTIDTMSHCAGIFQNAMKLRTFGADFYYGAEIAHTDIPWGIDANELHYMLHLTGMSVEELFHTATAKAGEYLGLAPLGTLTAGAPADLIAVRGNPFMSFKILEYPQLVMSGGKAVVNKYSKP